MSDDPIQSLLSPDAPTPKGRRADLLACILAALGAVTALIIALWFFFGFAENDTRPEHLFSVLIFTLGIFGLAIVPFATISRLAFITYKMGGKLAFYLWTIFLTLPWLGLGFLSLVFTPLPFWVGGLAVLLSILLALWALTSIILDFVLKNKDVTQTLDRIEVTEDSI